MRYRILRSLRHYPMSWALGPLLVYGLGAVLLVAGAAGTRPRLVGVLTWAGGLGLAPPTLWWVFRWLLPALSTRRWVDRRDDAAVQGGGVATALDVAEVAGLHAMREQARTLRPSLAHLSRRQLRHVDPTGYAVPLLRCGWLPWGSWVWSSCEEVTLRIGGPRTGKTGSLACHALDAPGPLILTTTRTDLLDLTREARAARGRVDVFNPTGLGLLPSSVRWSPLAGCRDLGTARRRAGDLIPESVGEGERWDAQARALLAILLHAAALSGRRTTAVLGWVSPADDVALGQIVNALTSSPSAESLVAEVRSVYTTNERTKTSITATLLPAVRWLADATAAQIGDAPLDAPDFLDVTALVAGRDTNNARDDTPDNSDRRHDSLYLIGREGTCRPLVGALTAEIAHQARMVAGASAAGRLDPPLTMVLDEAPLTCGPVPLQDWTADMGGRGVTVHIAAQSLAQLRDTWGKDRAGVILGNTAALLVFGGLKTADDVADVSTLAGSRLVPLDYDDNRYVPVMTPGEIAALPAGTALLLRNGLRPIIGRPPLAWNRRPAPRPAHQPAHQPAPRPVQAAARLAHRTAAAIPTATLMARRPATTPADVVDLTDRAPDPAGGLPGPGQDPR